jgi:methylmalonyl-CoA/ethylmalonyl-CoA epimerase
MRGTVLDHVAVATRVLTDGWELFGGILGGRWAYGGNDPGYWWGQLQFRAGPKVELLTPTGGPDAAFLERFLTTRGPGPHHLNFGVTDIRDTLTRVRDLGIEPVGISLDSPTWKEAFLHPRDAYGIVIQVAQQSGPPPQPPRPAELPEPGEPADLSLTELRVDDIDGAVRLYSEALQGEVLSRSETEAGRAADLTWQSGTRIRLVQDAAGGGAAPGHRTETGLSRLCFSRAASASCQEEPARIATLSGRLGVPLELTGSEPLS